MPVAEAILRLGHVLYHDPAIDVEYAGTGGGYFMAQEDQDAVLCRTVLEHREAKEHEARLDKEAKRKGYSLKDQAHMPHFLGDRLFRNSDYPNVESKSNGLRQNSANWARRAFAWRSCTRGTAAYPHMGSCL